MRAGNSTSPSSTIDDDGDNDDGDDHGGRGNDDSHSSVSAPVNSAPTTPSVAAPRNSAPTTPPVTSGGDDRCHVRIGCEANDQDGPAEFDVAGNVRLMRLNVVEQGTGPTVVFLHGMGSTSATWTACMNLLAPTHRVVALDLLGHGASPVPEDPAEYTRDAALVDIDELLATLPPAVLVGHSLGGYLAMAHAATRPHVARGIIVLNTGPGFRDAEKRQQWNERSRRNAHRFGVPVQAAQLNLQHDSVVMDRLAEITVPTLVLAGGADRPEYTASGQYIERKMAQARVVVVEGGAHAMHEASHATEVAEIIAEFVASLPPVA